MMSRNTEKIYRKQALETISPLVDDYVFYAGETEKLVTVLSHILAKKLGYHSPDIADIINNSTTKELIILVNRLFKKI